MNYVRIKGGLGNQMFQYALAKRLRCDSNEKVIIDTSCYYEERNSNREFVLKSAFPEIEIEELTRGELYKQIAPYTGKNPIKKLSRRRIDNGVNYYLESKEFQIDPGVFGQKDTYFDGYWQTPDYWDGHDEIIQNDFHFNKDVCRELDETIKKISSKNAVSVHIRRGDYLTGINKKIYGYSCTDEYYMKAVELIDSCVETPEFIVFSDDIRWANDYFAKFGIKYDCYIKQSETIPDWAEMMLMSECKHNIIANSTFSWWGAYLNKNPNKTVVAPKLWISGIEETSIVPPEWYRI